MELAEKVSEQYDPEDRFPPFLLESIENMKQAWLKKDAGEYCNWDCDYCDLQSSINVAEVEHLISSETAWALREKYLYLRKPNPLDPFDENW